MEIIERQEAIQRGLTHYFTGRPCSNGHIDKRYVKTTKCFECNNEKMAKRRLGKWRFRTSRETLAAEKKLVASAILGGAVKYASAVKCAICFTSERYTKGRACVACQRDKCRDKYHSDPTGQNAKRKLRRLANIDKERARDREYRLKNKDMVSVKHVDLRRKKRAEDPVFAMKHRIRSLISSSISRFGYKKDTKTAEILGCTWNEFKTHIERQFLPGMSWDNRSEWHVDHITPMAMAKTEAEAVALNHFTNLRPLWGPDNIAKGGQVQFLI